MSQPRVPVVSMDEKPLMPTTAAHARIMLRDKVAKPRRNKLGLFYIQMVIPVGAKTQPMALAVDPGARYDGIAVASHRQVEFSAQVDLPDDVHKKMDTRRSLRRSRRFRKTPRRPKRFDNRRHGMRYWLTPTQASKVHSRVEAVKALCRIYPVQRIIVENVRHRPCDGRKGNFFSTAEVGKRKANAEFEALASVTVVEASETAGWRQQFGLPKIRGPRRSPVFEAQAVDAAAMLMGVTGCAIGAPSFHVFKAFRFARRSLHRQNPQKGGSRPAFGGTSNGTFFRKGDWVEVRSKGCKIRGWVCGLPTARTPKIGVAGSDGVRIAQFGPWQARLLARAGGFTWRREAKAVLLPTVKTEGIRTAA